MKLKSLLLIPLFLYAVTACFGQAGYTHVELQGGYELFPDMSSKSGLGLNLGARYAFDEKYFIATLLHCGINNGSYKDLYAGETTKLKHTLREYMIGAGPGIYLYNGGSEWIYTDILIGYGFGEELKASENSRRRSLNGLASAIQIGVERQTESGWVVGMNLGGYLVGGNIRPAISVKCGALLNIF